MGRSGIPALALAALALLAPPPWPPRSTGLTTPSW